jgi:GalNAc-alpha-(1->4)-GalNAc-alpha-(1->3)-diNAcBac-PP-undecaprenol alpha-1,4-N-acetyl-D-galactosaminyltransferase
MFVTGGLVSGGAERVLSIIANGLNNRGYDVSIISKQQIKPFYNLNLKVKVVYPTTRFSYKNTLKTLLSRLAVYIDIFKILKFEKPDIVIPFSTTTNGSIIIIAKLLNIKVIASEHNNYKVGLQKRSIWLIKRVIYKMTDYLMVLTQRDVDEYYGNFIKNIVVMPNPLPLSPINSNDEYKRENTILAIGNVSRWEHKGFDNLLSIFAHLKNRIPEYKLLIAGAGDPTYLKQICIELNIESKVEFLGEVTDIAYYMQKASVFTLTSRWEGLPMVLIEAMSQGLPCIAYDCFSGPADVITDGKDGVLIEDQNNEKFARELLSLIEDKKRQAILSKEGISTVKKYEINTILNRWENLLNKLED